MEQESGNHEDHWISCTSISEQECISSAHLFNRSIQLRWTVSTILSRCCHACSPSYRYWSSYRCLQYDTPSRLDISLGGDPPQSAVLWDCMGWSCRANILRQSDHDVHSVCSDVRGGSSSRRVRHLRLGYFYASRYVSYERHSHGV